MDHLTFWNMEDLERRLGLFQNYYNRLRVHQGLDGDTPDEKAGAPAVGGRVKANFYQFMEHSPGMIIIPID